MTLPGWLSALTPSDRLTLSMSALAVILSLVSYLKTNAASRAEVFLEFRKRFSELKGSIPTWYNAASIPANASEAELRAAELYWQNAFDEWFVTNQLEWWHLRKLWTRFYKGTMTLALRHGALRQVAANLTHSGVEFGNRQEQFRATLNGLCRSAYGQPLCGQESCEKCGTSTRAGVKRRVA